MEDEYIERDPRWAAPQRKRGLAGLLERLRAAQQPPEPFRDSDFENVEGGRSPFDVQPGRAD